MKYFVFDLQRFAEVSIAAGNKHKLDGVTYAAVSDAVLNLDDDGKVSGIASGSVVATLTDEESSPRITFDGSTPFDFKCTSWESGFGTKAIHVKGSSTASINYTGGSVTYSAQGASADAGELSVTGLISKVLPFDVKLDIPDAGMAFTVEGKTTTVNAPEKVNATLTFPENITTALENFKPLIGILLDVDEDTANKLYDLAYKLATSETTAQIEGTLSWNQDEKRLTVNEDSLMAINILDYALSLTAVGGNVDGLSFFYQMISETELSAGAKFTPSTDENAGLNLTFAKNDSTVYDGLINITAGAIDIDVVNAKASVEKDTALTITTPAGNLVQFKFDDAASFTYSADADGLSTFNFGENDGKLEMTLYNGDKAILTAGLEINGALTIDTKNETIGVTKDTTTKITIGEYEATINVTTDTGITITPKDDKFYVTADEGNSAFDLKIVRGEYTVFEGNLDISGAIEFDAVAHSLSVSQGSTVTLTRDDTVTTLTATDDAGLAFSLEGDNITLTPNKGDGSIDITIKQGEQTVFAGNLAVTGGSIVIGDMGQTIGLTAGASMAVTLGNYTLDITANDDAGFGLAFLNDGSIAITPQDNDGSFDISINRGSTSIFSNTVSISAGTITFNPTTQLMTLTSGTTISLDFAPYTLTATASGDASSTISFTGDGITIAPQTDDGTLKLTLTGTSSGSLSADIEVLSGSFTLGDGGAITVAQDTELQIKFSDNYIVNFKASDAAGGTISLGKDGITFKPGSNDGGLQLSVTRGTDTRSASLDVTGGSVTYKLDGSISLAKGTVVKNVFDSGNILTITANTDASGSINFNPQTGLTIKPTTTDALTVSLTTSDIEVVNITSIDGSITYQNGIVTATDDTRARITYYFGWESDLYTKGGTASLQFTTDRTVYIANEGANFVIDYLDRTTAEIQNGTYSDIYATETSDAIELVSVGSTFRSNDAEQVITLEKAGTYTLNGMQVTTSQDNTQVLMPDYDTITFADDAPVKVSTVEGGKIFMVAPGEDSISFSTKRLENTEVTGGAVEFDNTTKKLSATEGTALSITRDDTVSTFTISQDVSLSYKVEEDIYYFMPDGEVAANISVTNDGQTTFTGNLTAGGVLSYRPETGTFGLTGANSSHGDGNNTFAEITTDNGYSVKLATNDTTVTFIPKLVDGKLELNFPNEAKNTMLFTLGKDGNQILERQLIVNGTIGVDNASQELSLTKDTVLSLSSDGENWLEITALDDASGQLTFTEEGIRFAPNAGDGKLQLTIDNRQATLDVATGAIILNNDGMMSLEKDSVLNIAWEDGTALTMSASDTGGAIGFDSQGLKISSEGELSVDLTTATGVQTTLQELNGSIHYNAGKVLFDADSTLTATSSLGGLSTNITLESNGTGGYIEISATGTRYVAGTGALKVTWSRDGKESSFSINSGSVYIGHGIFQIAEGSDLSTDLKDLISTLYFTTTTAGTYTINGQTITTTAENISMTATDDYMTFATSDDPVTYNGMSFAGAGNVSLSTAGVVLGAGVEAEGFGKDKSFILAEAGNVTADARIFELTEDVPTGITVTGAEDGFIFSRTNTEESEARFDDPDPDNVGKNFTEQFFLTNDDSYRIQSDLLGLQQIIGVSAPSTVNASATFGGEEFYSIFDIVTDEEGTFDIAEKTYSINGDPEVEIKSRFEEGQASVLAFNDLSGTISGDFTAHEVSVNGSASAVQVFGDENISIAADDSGFEISGLDKDASLKVAATDSYVVNGTTINANAGDYIVGEDDSAYLLALNNDTLVRGTALDDKIFNVGSNVSINGGAGSDSIANNGSNVSINAGDGDDLITNTGDNVLFKYYSTGGNDSIVGFNSTSTLSIADEYSSSISGNDLIVTVGDSKITLVDAATLSSANIESTNLSPTEQLVDTILKRTALGYPAMAARAFSPDAEFGDEPTNYAEKEDWSITSTDNLKLHAVHYTPENSNDKWVVLVHGYGNNHKAMYLYATSYLENGYNVLMIDQRAAGESEGTWLTMGGAESKDVALWTQEIARRNSNAKITLHGVSMGSATAMLAASRSDATNVVALIEDCGYTSAMEVFYLLNGAYVGAPTEVIAGMDGVAEEFTGHYISEAAPIDSISSAKMPTLFISGDADTVVPVSMLSELYDASGAEVKEKFIVKDAPHALAGLNDSVGYSNAVFRFVAEASGEGWNTTNITDNISLRGTKYNDTIANYGSYVTINAGDGDDSINNISEYSIIDGGSGNDTIYNYSPTGLLLSNAVSINGGADDDTIINEHAYYVTLDGGEGDDKIIVRLGDHTTIDGGAGNDTIIGEIVDSQDSAWAMGGYANINGGSGDDYINPIFSDSASILGGDGNDTIINQGDDATISGGAGDDVISLQGASLNNDVIKYEVGDGFDTIYGFNETTKLSITAGSEYSTVESGDDVIVNVGDNAITIAGGAGLSTINILNYEIPALNISNTTNNTLITGTENDDTIKNSGDDVSIKGAAGNDSISNSGANSSINGGAGSDTIRNEGASSGIFGAEGDDRLINTADEALIDGSYGSDTISNSGSNVTIRPGGGSDSISNSGDNVVISYAGGNDSISGFNATSKLSLSSDDYEVAEGSRDIFVFHDESFAVLQGALLTNDSININDTVYAVEGKVITLEDGGDEVTISRSNVSIVGGTGDDIISLGSETAKNTIEYAAGNDTIYGVNETTRLSIAGDYSSIKIGSDVIVTVGNNTITLVDASDAFATDFEEGESFLLTEKGAVTVGNRIFELTEKVKSGVTITGTTDGFTSGITDKDGKTFVEKFIAEGDDSYHVLIDGAGLQTISGIDAGTEITTGATKDGEEEENQIYIVTEDAGSYTFNDMTFTAGTANAVIRLRPQAMAFDSSDEIVYDGKIFTGSGFVTVSSDIVAMGAGVVADGFEDGESFILMQRGAVTVDGKTFELTENVKQNMTVGVEDDGYTFSHKITQKDATLNNEPDSYIGKTFSENVIVEGDETYSLRADTFGLRRVRGISDGASINGGDTNIDGNSNDKYAQGGQYFYVDTDTEGVFTIGEKAYSISGDSNVEIVADFLREKSYASGFASLDGTVSGDFTSDEFYVNGSKNPILIYGDDSIKVVGSSSGTKLYDISDGASLASLGGVREVHTDTEGEFWIGAEPVPFGVTVTGDDNVTFGFNAAGDLMSADNLEGSIRFSKGTGGELSINGIGIHTKNTAFSSIGAYDDSLYIHDIERGTISAGEKVWLQMTGETMTLNGNRLTLTNDADGIWIRNKEIVGLDDGASLQVSKGGTYTANETSLKAKAGDVIIGLENDAYIYDANNPLITNKTSNADIINQFTPKKSTVVGGASNVTLGGGDLAIIENTSEEVNITAGDDTIVSRGENVHVTLTPEKNTWLFPLEGKMSLEGYDASTGSGFGTTYKDILSEIEKGNVDFNNGILKLGSAQVDMNKNSELMNFFNRYGGQQKVGFASQNDSLDVSDKTDDLLLVAKKNGSIRGGSGDDTILANGGNSIDGGEGENLVSLNGGSSTIVFDGRTTVEGFKTGFGDGDTIYIAGDPAGVEFKSDGLTFSNDDASLILSDVTTTAKVNIYHERRKVLNRGVFISENDCYEATDADLVAGDGEEIYFVGTSGKANHGVDFSGVSEALDVTLDTEYEIPDNKIWINGVYSIRGGAGSTTITGSDKNDTILAGTGETSINGGAGHDKLIGTRDNGQGTSTFYFNAGDGRDSIENFDFTTDAQDVTADKIKLDDNSAISEVHLRGSDVMIKVDGADGHLMLEDAQGKSFRVNDDLIAKVDTNVAFDGFTNCYVGIGARATLTVGKDSGNVEVWLSDDSLDYHGTMYDGNFAVLDASQSDGSNILAGNELSNVIMGGSGSNSLWGGYSSEDDTLIGGAGQNTFFYGIGNGRDKIQNANAGDEIILDDITLDQITEANITAGGVMLNFQDGGSLTIEGTADVTYQLADGSKYSANHSQREWNSK